MKGSRGRRTPMGAVAVAASIGCAAAVVAVSSSVLTTVVSPAGPLTDAPLTTAAARHTGSMVVSLVGWATVRIPRSWHVTPFRGESAPAYFPLDFLSTDPLPPMCHGGVSETCVGRNWFGTGWAVPSDGVVVLWSHAEFPAGPPLEHVDGRAATVDGSPARVSTGPATGRCPAGAATEIDAYVSTWPQTGERMDMTACLGPRAKSADRVAVRVMLAGLHRRLRH